MFFDLAGVFQKFLFNYILLLIRLVRNIIADCGMIADRKLF